MIHDPTTAGTTPRRPRVLLVEDQALVAMEFEAMLADLGCAVIGPFARVAPALHAARSEPLDGAVLDVNLAGERSFPIAHLLLALQIPFFFVTGLTSAALPPPLQDVPSLTKPVRTQAFAALVQQFLVSVILPTSSSSAPSPSST
jgi:CheY-like chemotaxis protein